MDSPKLSIITINLNNKAGLLKTIISVINQTISDFEYIIIDGGSTDGSVELIEKYTYKITYWVSEPDKGIYNAMNKGIKIASGEYCLFLNSGDWLVDNNVLNDFINAHLEHDIVSGNIQVNENSQKKIIESPYNENLDFRVFYEGSLPHQSTFIKRELFNVHGLFNENYRIVADGEFFIKCLLIYNCTYSYFDRVISFFDINGISSKPEMKSLADFEKELVFNTTIPVYYRSYKKLKDENIYFLSHENAYREYISLKNGKFSILIKLLLFFKRIIK